MKKVQKFIAECGYGSDSRYGDVLTMDDYELENAYHAGQRWIGNMVCGTWEGSSTASSAIKKEYNRRLEQRKKERIARYKEEITRINNAKEAAKAETIKKLSRLKTTKQSFEQDVWKEYAYSLYMSILNFKLEAKFIDDNVKKYKEIVEKWSKLKNINKDKVKFGKTIIAALENKSKHLKEIVEIFNAGKGEWWDVSIPIESNKTFTL